MNFVLKWKTIMNAKYYSIIFPNHNQRLRLKGFTLVEMIISLMITSMIVMIVPLWLKIMYVDLQNFKAYERYEFELFVTQLTHDLKNAKSYEILPTEITYIDGEENDYKISVKHGRVIKQKNEQGYIIMIDQIKGMSNICNQYTCEINIERNNEHETIYYFKHE